MNVLQDACACLNPPVQYLAVRCLSLFSPLFSICFLFTALRRGLAGTAGAEGKKAREPLIACLTIMLLAAAGRLALQMAPHRKRAEVIMALQRAPLMVVRSVLGAQWCGIETIGGNPIERIQEVGMSHSRNGLWWGRRSLRISLPASSRRSLCKRCTSQLRQL